MQPVSSRLHSSQKYAFDTTVPISIAFSFMVTTAADDPEMPVPLFEYISSTSSAFHLELIFTRITYLTTSRQ